MLRSRDGVAAGRVHHDNPALSGRLDIDIVGAHPGAAHDPEPGRGLDHLFRYFRLRAHDQSDRVADQRHEFHLRQPLLEDPHLEFGPLLEQSDALG